MDSWHRWNAGLPAQGVRGVQAQEVLRSWTILLLFRCVLNARQRAEYGGVEVAAGAGAGADTGAGVGAGAGAARAGTTRPPCCRGQRRSRRALQPGQCQAAAAGGKGGGGAATARIWVSVCATIGVQRTVRGLAGHAHPSQILSAAAPEL
eukprot:m.249873 g.249873  ORF g.249873 m.249873 type:complete len:150 (-) comp26690_c2_seq6:2624-3073(-)